jgi:hypothetical protein
MKSHQGNPQLAYGGASQSMQPPFHELPTSIFIFTSATSSNNSEMPQMTGNLLIQTCHGQLKGSKLLSIRISHQINTNTSRPSLVLVVTNHRRHEWKLVKRSHKLRPSTKGWLTIQSNICNQSPFTSRPPQMFLPRRGPRSLRSPNRSRVRTKTLSW